MLDGTQIKLGNIDYTVPPLNLKSLRSLLPRIQAMKATAIPSDEDIDTIIDVIHAALLRNYPEVTREQLESVLDMGNMQQAMRTVLGASGLTSGNGNAATVNP